MKLVSRRARDRLQVLAGSATLDRQSTKKLEKLLKGHNCSSAAQGPSLPLRTVTLAPSSDVADSSFVSMRVKTKRDEQGAAANERVTLLPREIAHRSVTLSNKNSSDAQLLDALSRAILAVKPRAAIVFVCSSSGLKVREVAAALRVTAALPATTTTAADAALATPAVASLDDAAVVSGATETRKVIVLGDALWPSAARNARRQRKGGRSAAVEQDAEQRDALTRAAAASLAVRLRAATATAPMVVVADQAATRGLHLDALDAVFVLGKPANADTYLHLAGRVSRDPFRGTPNATAQQAQLQHAPVAVTLGSTKDLKVLRSWLDELGVLDLTELDC